MVTLVMNVKPVRILVRKVIRILIVNAVEQKLERRNVVVLAISATNVLRVIQHRTQLNVVNGEEISKPVAVKFVKEHAMRHLRGVMACSITVISATDSFT